nr:site-specific integrase [Actinomycetota bacterium]
MARVTGGQLLYPYRRRVGRDSLLALGEFLDDIWLPAVRSTIRLSTFVGYEGHVRNHIIPRLGGTILSELDARVLNAFYATLLANGHRDLRPLSPATVRRIHATLHRALRDAVRWGHLEKNPGDACDPPRQRAASAPEMRTWAPAQLAAFLGFVRGDRLSALWVLLAMTGLRRGEALGLRWIDVNIDRGELAVRQTVLLVSGRIEVSRPKTARGRRVVALDPSTADILAKHRQIGPDSELVFSDQDGSPLNPGAVSKRFSKLVRASGLPLIRLHDLRHTHATIALQAGVHPKIVSERLGHSTVAFTLDVYSHMLPHMQAEAAAAVAALVPLGEP